MVKIARAENLMKCGSKGRFATQMPRTLILLFGLLLVTLIAPMDTVDIQAQPQAEKQKQNVDLKEYPGATNGLKKILSSKKLRVGLQYDYPPFHIGKPKPGFPGIDVEIAQELANTLEVKLEFVFGDTNEMMALIQSKTVDVALGGHSGTLFRRKYVSFTDPYIITSPGALIAKNRLGSESESVDFPKQKLRSISDMATLQPLTIAVKDDTTSENILRNDRRFNSAVIKGFPERIDGLDALLKGKVDALVADRIYIQSLLLQRPILSADFQPLLDDYKPDHLCMMVNQGDSELVEYLNFFIKEMIRSGTFARISSAYQKAEAW